MTRIADGIAAGLRIAATTDVRDCGGPATLLGVTRGDYRF
jgi:hypothetical protein